MDRERLGQIVRAEWVRFAQEQPNPKPSHLLLWEELDEANKEVDRRIGEAVAVAMMEEGASPDHFWKASRPLWRAFVRGTITSEQYQLESLKLAVQMKEEQYLRCAVELIEARKEIARLEQEVKRLRGESDDELSR